MQMQAKRYPINFTEEQLNLLNEGLGALPFGRVAATFADINEQIAKLNRQEAADLEVAQAKEQEEKNAAQTAIVDLAVKTKLEQLIEAGHLARDWDAVPEVNGDCPVVGPDIGEETT